MVKNTKKWAISGSNSSQVHIISKNKKPLENNTPARYLPETGRFPDETLPFRW